jgi:DNA-binding response OmpR family regulator
VNAPLPSRHFPEAVIGPGDGSAVRRFREAGDLTLDLNHRDGRVDDRWLGLSSCEFGLLWRLAEQPGETVTAGQLLAGVCLVAFGPACGEIPEEIASARAKLGAAGLAHLIGGDAAGGYVLEVPSASRLMRLG